jgi:hypothetical protein
MKIGEANRLLKVLLMSLMTVSLCGGAFGASAGFDEFAVPPPRAFKPKAKSKRRCKKPVNHKPKSIEKLFWYSGRRLCRSGDGQSCSNFANWPFETGLEDDYYLEMLVPPGNCSPTAYLLTWDGNTLGWTDWLKPGQSAIVAMGRFPPGNHALGISALGRLGGCNKGSLINWELELTLSNKYSDGLPLREAPSLPSSPETELPSVFGTPGDTALNSEYQCDKQTFHKMAVEIVARKRALNTKYKELSKSQISRAKEHIQEFIADTRFLKQCAARLGVQYKPKCHIRWSTTKELGSGVILREFQFESIKVNGACGLRNTKQASIYNSQGKRVVQRTDYIWTVDKSLVCRSESRFVPETRRSLSFGAYDPQIEGSRGYFSAIDWTPTSAGLNVSNHQARMVAFARKTQVSLAMKNGLLVFRWSNGARISIDPESGNVVQSNFLHPMVYKQSSCQTKARKEGRQVRFVPEIKLISRFKHLKIRTVSS